MIINTLMKWVEVRNLLSNEFIEENSLNYIRLIDYAIKNNIYYMRWENDR